MRPCLLLSSKFWRKFVVKTCPDFLLIQRAETGVPAQPCGTRNVNTVRPATRNKSEPKHWHHHHISSIWRSRRQWWRYHQQGFRLQHGDLGHSVWSFYWHRRLRLHRKAVPSFSLSIPGLNNQLDHAALLPCTQLYLISKSPDLLYFKLESWTCLWFSSSYQDLVS